MKIIRPHFWAFIPSMTPFTSINEAFKFTFRVYSNSSKGISLHRVRHIRSEPPWDTKLTRRPRFSFHIQHSKPRYRYEFDAARESLWTYLQSHLGYRRPLCGSKCGGWLLRGWYFWCPQRFLPWRQGWWSKSMPNALLGQLDLVHMLLQFCKSNQWLSSRIGEPMYPLEAPVINAKRPVILLSAMANCKPFVFTVTGSTEADCLRVFRIL